MAERKMDNSQKATAATVISAMLSEMKKGIHAEAVDDGWVYVDTPLLDAHFDLIGFYVKRDEKKNTISFSDDGYAIGLYMNSGHSQTAAGEVARAAGVKVVDGELVAEAPADKTGEMAVAFLNALLALSL